MNTINKLYTANKYKDELTSYAMHCGYVQYRNNKDLQVIHGMYRVSSLNEQKYFDTIKEARKYLYN